MVLYNKFRERFLLACVILYGVCIPVLTGSIQHQFTGLRRDGFKLLPETIDQKLNSVDLIGCTTECVKTSNCLTVSWSFGQKKCLLSSLDVAHDKNANERLTPDNGWTTKVLMKYTVFSANTGSSISFSQAKALCIDRQTVMASRADLLYSHSLGFHYQRCHWLSDGSIGFVVQNKNGIQSCSASSNPWAMCILN